MEAKVRWECEHGDTIVHWEQLSGSRARICSMKEIELRSIPWCDTDDAPARLCNHEPVDGLVWMRRNAVPVA